MAHPLQPLHPVLLAVADVAVGVALYGQFGAPLGLVVAAVGLLVVCGVAWQTVRGEPVGAGAPDRRAP